MTSDTTKIGCGDAPKIGCPAHRQTPSQTLPAQPAHPQTSSRYLQHNPYQRQAVQRRRPRRTSYGAWRINAIENLLDDPCSLQLPLSPLVPLVKIDTVVAARGEEAPAIHKYVESGSLRWVFNVAVNPAQERDLRFWNRELTLYATNLTEEHGVLRNSDVRFVMKKILGDREEFRPGEICLLMGVSRATLMRLRHELPGTDKLVAHASLEEFLTRRLVR